MQLRPELLVVVGCLCLVLALGEAWCLAGIRYLSIGWLKRLFPNDTYLLKSHIDFLLMTGLLFVSYLLFAHFAVQPAAIVLLAMCIGSVANPLGFVVLAIRPGLQQTPTSAFGAVMSVSFVLTTIGYLGTAWEICRAAIASS